MATPLGRARAGLGGRGQALADVSGAIVGSIFRGVSAVRRAKSLHPHGAVHEAVVRITGVRAAPPGVALLNQPAEHPAIIRFSRSFGFPQRLPDLLGISLRFLDVHGPGRHQDLLMVSSIDLPVLHHVFVPAADVQQRPYSSSLPYEAPGGLYLVGVLPRKGSPRPSGGTELERLAAAATTGRLRFDLAACSLGGRFAPIGEISVGPRLPQQLDGLRFNPWNTGGGMVPHGLLNRLRGYAYPASQRGWMGSGSSAPEGGGALLDEREAPFDEVLRAP